MNYENAKAEQIIGKTIAEAFISSRQVEIKFTDGTEININLEFYGYDGARLDNTYWPNNQP